MSLSSQHAAALAERDYLAGMPDDTDADYPDADSPDPCDYFGPVTTKLTEAELRAAMAEHRAALGITLEWNTTGAAP